MSDINTLPKHDYEQKTIDFAKRVLDDIPECRDADYSVRWQRNTQTKDVVPFLVLAFSLPHTDDKPAIAVSLVAVQKSTLLEAMPGKTPLEGDRLRDHILRSVFDYFQHHGIVLTLPVPT